MKRINIIYIIMIIILSTITLALDECKGTMVQNEIPCLLLLNSNDCSNMYINVYKESTFIYSQQMITYNPFMCNATFNQLDIGTYSGNYSSGDTFTIIIEEDNMISFFYLSVYGCFTLIGIIFMLFMHLFKEDRGTSVVYGTLSSAIFFIMMAMLISGFQLIKDVTFFFDINYYIIALFASIGLYTSIVSYNLWKFNRTKVETDYYD